MKKSVWIILFALLAFAALPALAVTDGELLSVEIVFPSVNSIRR